MKTNHIINGDACQALPKLPDASFQVIIADLPYYNVLTDEAWNTQWHSEEAYLSWSLQWARECMRLSKSDGLFSGRGCGANSVFRLWDDSGCCASVG